MAHANPYTPGQVETLEQAQNELVKLADVVNQRRMIDESEAEEEFKQVQRGKLDALLAGETA